MLLPLLGKARSFRLPYQSAHLQQRLSNITGLADKNTMNSPSLEAIQRRITLLEVEHRDLDLAIQALLEAQTIEELQIRRMKKRKLQLKDHITLLKMQLVPDIPA